jgi:hypothetical protein
VGENVNVVEVGSTSPAVIPKTGIDCVEPGVFCVLSVTAMLAVRAPADCGVNRIDTSQLKPVAKLVLDVHRFVSLVFWENSMCKLDWPRRAGLGRQGLSR